MRVCTYNMITLSYGTFMKIPKLFEIYVISLILTENTCSQHMKIDLNMKGYHTKTRYLWKKQIICEDHELIYINRRNLYFLFGFICFLF